MLFLVLVILSLIRSAPGLLANLKETREVKRACRVEATSIMSVVNKLWL
jgi:hypothetical protein